MKRPAGVALVSVLSLALCAAWSGDALAKKRRGKGRGKAAQTVPNASAEEIERLKGDYKWGMSLDAVVKQVAKRVEEGYADRLKQAALDPTRQDRVRKQMRAEVAGIKDKYVEFTGLTSGYDVSIVDKEFAHKTGESMLVAKEDNATRYFFFADGRLYKMFIAFDKEILKDRSFEDFGALMQERFGKAREVSVDIKRREEVTKKLDHYEWASKAGDGLRLVDRSEFYDVYCLVVYDRAVANRLAESRRRLYPDREDRNALVDAVINNQHRDAPDVNANIIDRVTGNVTNKPGQGPQDIVVPTSQVTAPTPEQVNQAPAGPRPAGAKAGKARSAEPELEL